MQSGGQSMSTESHGTWWVTTLVLDFRWFFLEIKSRFLMIPSRIPSPCFDTPPGTNVYRNHFTLQGPETQKHHQLICCGSDSLQYPNSEGSPTSRYVHTTHEVKNIQLEVVETQFVAKTFQRRCIVDTECYNYYQASCKWFRSSIYGRLQCFQDTKSSKLKLNYPKLAKQHAFWKRSKTPKGTVAAHSQKSLTSKMLVPSKWIHIGLWTQCPWHHSLRFITSSH